MTEAIRASLERSDAVICCGGLGPTQDDITREALADVMGVPLELDDSLAERIESFFAGRGRSMAANNLRQAEVPKGATVIPQVRGTAPGLICPVGEAVAYAVPGVPAEMKEMLERAVIPDLVARSGSDVTIASRTLRTWGLAESSLAELLAPRLEALDRAGNPTIAFLASGIEGIKVRITAKAKAADAVVLLDAEEENVRRLVGPFIFGVDDETMEVVVGKLLVAGGQCLAVAESLTGGLIGARLTAVPGASDWFRGGVVSYASEVKRDVLGVGPGPVVSAEAAEKMAAGIRSLLGSTVGLAVTGVAGPAEQEGQPPGTVWIGLADGTATTSSTLRLPGEREQVRQLTVISALDLLRRHLLEVPGRTG
jgi:nicotinamide-nucleotide amidase